MYDTCKYIKTIRIIAAGEEHPRSKRFAIVFGALGLTSNEHAPSEVQARANLPRV